MTSARSKELLRLVRPVAFVSIRSTPFSPTASRTPCRPSLQLSPNFCSMMSQRPSSRGNSPWHRGSRRGALRDCLRFPGFAPRNPAGPDQADRTPPHAFRRDGESQTRLVRKAVRPEKVGSNRIMVHRSIISCIYYAAHRALDLVPEFGRAAELRAKIAVYIIGEALCKALPVHVARNVFEEHQHGELVRAGMLEFFFHHEPSGRCFPASSRAEDKKKNVAAVDGVEAGIPRRTGLRREILIDQHRVSTGLFDPAAGGLPIFRESFNDGADEHPWLRHIQDRSNTVSAILAT
jgi:hypothetical protein